MSYSALGAMNKAILAKMLSVKPLKLSAGPKCYVGWASQTPWGKLRTYGGGKPAHYGASLVSHSLSSSCGTSDPCAPSTGADGVCLSPSKWNDALYQQQKNWFSLYRKKESRVRHLLWRLSQPLDDFPTGLHAYAYDAAFCHPVFVDARFVNAVKNAFHVMESKFPDSRFFLQKGDFHLTCKDSECNHGGWHDELKVPLGCMKQTVLDAPSYCEMVSSAAGAGHGDLNERLIPIAVALRVSGDKLGPSLWLKRLLDCLTPGW